MTEDLVALFVITDEDSVELISRIVGFVIDKHPGRSHIGDTVSRLLDPIDVEPNAAEMGQILFDENMTFVRIRKFDRFIIRTRICMAPFLVVRIWEEGLDETIQRIPVDFQSIFPQVQFALTASDEGYGQFSLQDREPEMEENRFDNLFIAFIPLHSDDENTCPRFIPAETFGDIILTRYGLPVIIVVIAHVGTLLSLMFMGAEGRDPFKEEILIGGLRGDQHSPDSGYIKICGFTKSVGATGANRSLARVSCTAHKRVKRAGSVIRLVIHPRGVAVAHLEIIDTADGVLLNEADHRVKLLFGRRVTTPEINAVLHVFSKGE